MLLVAAAALVLYFGRDFVFPPKSPGAETAEQGDGTATSADSTASGDASEEESESLADQIAGKIVERIEEKVTEDAEAALDSDIPAAGAGKSATTETTAPSVESAGASRTTTDSSTESADSTAGAAPQDEMQAGTATTAAGAGVETVSTDEAQVAADTATPPAEEVDERAGTVAQATDADESATTETTAPSVESAGASRTTTDSSTESADSTAGAAPQDEMQAGTATTAAGAGVETVSTDEAQVAADTATPPAEEVDERAGTVAQATDADESATTETTAPSVESAGTTTTTADSSTADAVPKDEVQAGTGAVPEDSTVAAVSDGGAQAGTGATGAAEDAPQTSDSSTPPPSEQMQITDADGQQGGVADGSTPAGREVPNDDEQLQLAEEVATRVAEKVSDIRPSPDPGTVAKAAAEVAEEFGLDVATLAQAVAEAVVQEQAQSFVDQIAEQDQQPLEVDEADHFVSSEQMVSLLPEASFEITSLKDLLSDPELEPHTPITVVREVEEIRIADPAKVIASVGGDLGREIKVLKGDELQVKTLAELLADLIESPTETITIVTNVKYFDVTTLSEFALQSGVADDDPLKVIKDRYTLEAATVAELLRQELDLPSNAIFYLRTVRPEDQQGIWGIVQEGISGNFARGMAIRYGQSINTYKVEIPKDADEILPDMSSSFLGKLIHDKTLQSYVYNFKHHRIGRNPDQVYPGQEIVIINFTPDELISIFKHFVEQRTAAG